MHPSLIILLLSVAVAAADWPMLRGSVGRTGFTEATVARNVSLQWSVEFEGERIGTAVEPIVTGGLLYAVTHAGNIYALDAASGAARWRFQANDAFLHSPAVHGDRVIAASVDGNVYALNAANGELAWTFNGPDGGFSASPLIAEDKVFIGSRSGALVALNMADGKVAWRRKFGAPIRQTAAFDKGHVYVTGEDLKVRSFWAKDGKEHWISEPLLGQTARDYYPVVTTRGSRRYVIVRTNPLLNMGQRIGRDRTVLARNAGFDDSGWQKVDAWIKSGQRGDAKLRAKEQRAIIEHLRANPDAQTFFALEADTGKRAAIPPVLWVAGCQAVGAPPALTADGRLLVFYRSAYGNWNHGVAPLVALGLLDLANNEIEPLFHQHGAQPQWNAFWGTADESQNFVVCNDTVLIVHQGTLSGFDLKKNELFTLFGERDRYGGFRNPPWARNEWHGPARSGVAVSDGRIYWQTGSRILCLAQKGQGAVAPGSATIRSGDVSVKKAPMREAPSRESLRWQLASTVTEVLSTNWAPLFVDPGLHGRDFSFEESAELLEGLAWAYPHLPAELQQRVRSKLREVAVANPPCKREGFHDLAEGVPREWSSVPREYRSRAGGDKQPHPFGNAGTFVFAAVRCGDAGLAREHWPWIKVVFNEFVKTGWRLDPAKGDLYANRYLASLMACARMAEQANDPETKKLASDRASETEAALVTWWKRAADRETLRTFNSSSELDPFIGKGDGLSYSVVPHRHKIALFQDLTPEVAAIIRSKAPEAVNKLWAVFDSLYRTWHLQGEERQVHFGENFVDPPDLGMGAFKALTWLCRGPAGELQRRIDLPFCRADLYYATRLALTMETSRP